MSPNQRLNHLWKLDLDLPAGVFVFKIQVIACIFVRSPGIAESNLCFKFRIERNYNVELNNNWLIGIICDPGNAYLFSDGNYLNYIHVNSGHVINDRTPGYGKCFS